MHCTCPLLGVKRTWLLHRKCLLMTQSGHRSPLPATDFTVTMGSSASVIGDETARVHHTFQLHNGHTADWSLAEREQISRIGVLMSVAANDPEGQARIAAFRQALQKLGWTEGQNVRIDVGWAEGDAALERKFANELVTLTPDVILATASPTVAALQAITRTVPTVFAHSVDPVGAGFAGIVWRGRAAMPPVSFCLSTEWARNGSNFSKRSRPT